MFFASTYHQTQSIIKKEYYEIHLYNPHFFARSNPPDLRSNEIN